MGKTLLDGDHFRETLERGGPNGDGSFGPAVALLGLLRSPVGRLGALALRLALALWLGNLPGLLLGWLALGAFAWGRTLEAAALETARTGFCPNGTLLANDGTTTFGDGTLLDADGNIWSAGGEQRSLASPDSYFGLRPEWPVRVTRPWEPTIDERLPLTAEAANRLVVRGPDLAQTLGNVVLDGLQQAAPVVAAVVFAGVVMAAGDAAPRQATPQESHRTLHELKHETAGQLCAQEILGQELKWALYKLETGKHELSRGLQELYNEEFVLQRRIFWAMLKAGYQLHSIYADRICLCHKKAHMAQLQQMLQRQRAVSDRIASFEEVILQQEKMRLLSSIKELEPKIAEAKATKDWVERRVKAAEDRYGDL